MARTCAVFAAVKNTIHRRKMTSLFKCATLGVASRLEDIISFFRRMFGGAAKPSTVKIQFDSGPLVEVPYGTTILQAATQNKVDLDSFCGGTCSCSTCRVEVLAGGKNLSKRKAEEIAVLGEERCQNGDRLSCQTKVLGDVVVRVPDYF